LFLGFSFDDGDFKKIYRLLNKDIAGLMPVSYVVTLDKRAAEKLKALNINATPIITSASFFIENLKEELVKTNAMLPDSRYDGLVEMYEKVLLEHEKTCELRPKEHPDALYSQWYQDGLLHAFERLLATKKSGENSCGYHLAMKIESYQSLIKECISYRNYPDAAYYTGYQTGLIFFLSQEKDRESMPIYFLFGGNDDILTFDDFVKKEKNAPIMHKSAHKLVVALSKKVKDNIVLHHRPF